jgi:phosphatidylinositol alpha-1,6-mannosyltransferase
MVFIEAAACGKPSLAGKDGGTGSAVIDGVTGLRVDGNRVADVAHGLQRMLVSPDLRIAMGKAGAERVEREFDWDVVASGTAALPRA